ncbi:alpha/beta hydrolase [Bifidobacterium sp. 82T10]|uniref:Alpha/beta hydrolase n=2 Tax=Bifidobacterium miconis TaxID=2834435 RepID=A0ABS6WD09_9BIFI|nr:alpha/beta hydrolase [Bifidobacterium miconis]MBW3091737.1 alpha/beta hydrolase [Bifidobacterium miconis]
MGESTQPAQSWGIGRRLMLRVPIFVILLGILVYVSNATTVSWNNEPTGQTIASLAADTAVTFDNPRHVTLHQVGDYDVTERTMYVTATRPATGEKQRIRVLIREPKLKTGNGDAGGTDDAKNGTSLGTNAANDEQSGATVRSSLDNLPGVVFMHGAGHGGTPDDSFGDVATSMASAGFVTAVIDKPIWSTNDVTRDYPASAAAYDQVVDLLRGLDNVDSAHVGIYATSESTWISSYLLRQDPNIAFQILLSPMVYTPRQSLGFLAAQDFALVGANDGYQSIVRRVFSADATVIGLTNFDLPDVPNTAAYSIPTFVAYGSKDVMTAQVEGTETIFDLARQAGNTDVTVRAYPIANHVMRLGSDEEPGTPFADDYVRDLTDWAVGTVAGLVQTSERVAGDSLYQSIAVPDDLTARRGMTVYGLILHASMLVMVLVDLIVTIAAAIVTLRARLGRRRQRNALGFAHGFGNALLTMTLTTLATLLLFAAGLGQVVMGVVRLAWGSAPDDDPGLTQWSWPVIQIVCTLVVWAWSGVFARLIEVAASRGMLQWPPRAGSIRAVVSGREPVLASTRLGRVLFWITAATMLYVLLFFAFWGLFVY